jgi:hypothetical protein
MRWFIMMVLCFGPFAALAQQPSPPAPVQPQASNCKNICLQGETNRLTAPEDTTLFFSCFMAGHCGSCKDPNDSKRMCNPIARELPPSGSPFDIFQRSIDGRV